MTLPLQLLLATFAAYRLAHMLALEDGPFDLFARFRDLIGTDRQATWIQRGFACPACISFWASLAATLPLAILHHLDLLSAIFLWLGSAGVALFLLKKSAV